MPVSRVFLLSSLLLTGLDALAQTTLKVTLVLVRERTACQPTGYEAGEDDQNCQQIRLSTVQKWTKEWPTMQLTIKPGDNQVMLTPQFSEKLHSLVRRCWPPKSKDRWAVVLWISGALGESLLIQRTDSGHANCQARGYRRTAPVTDRGNVINHQRADAFRPSMDAEWTFMSGRRKYQLSFTRPTE